MTEHVWPEFNVTIDETLADQTVIYRVAEIQRWVAWPPGRYTPDEPPKPEYQRTNYRPLGRVWETPGQGWVAAPPRLDEQPDDWHDEIGRSIRHFRTQSDACVFLYGHAYGVGSMRLAEAKGTLPWKI